MAANKLDQSLDEILSTQRQQRRTSGRTRRGGAQPGNPAPRAPAGGIQKPTKVIRNTAKAGQTKSFATGESKISVSNLPKDVSEAQIKDYFTQSVGPVKRVEISYGPGGISRGVASVVFQQADAASKAFKSLNGLFIDGKPVKVEVVISDVKLIPVVQPLGQRIQQVTKSQPKSAANDKSAKGPQNGASRGRGGKKVGGRGGRLGRTRKSEKELDAEMADYFDATAAPAAPDNDNLGTATTAAAGATNGDANMEDEIV